MHRFEDLSDVQAVLQRLIQREPPLAAMLPRQPGTKEARYLHLFCGNAPDWASTPAASAESSSGEAGRIARIEDDLRALRSELDDVKRQLTEFRAQFE
jgi:hypothetical protein